MKHASSIKSLFISLIALIGTASIAAHAERLTPQDCREYPFVQTSSPTHDQLEHDLSLLEREGYDPDGDENNYPADIQHAEKQLQRDYVRDCLHGSARSAM